MKKLLFQLDTDSIPSSFDGVVAYDSGIDHLLTFPGLNPANVEGIVHGAIFTRGGKDKQYTAMFVGGSNLAQGEALFDAVRKVFFSNFRATYIVQHFAARGKFFKGGKGYTFSLCGRERAEKLLGL